MKGRFALSPLAQADLDEIWDYIADRGGLEQAETYVRQLYEQILAVADKASLGRECDVVWGGYRLYPSGSSLLLYRPTDVGINIARILHERMDYERHIP